MRLEGRGRAGEEGTRGSKAGKSIGLESARFSEGAGSMSPSEDGMGDCMLKSRSILIRDAQLVYKVSSSDEDSNTWSIAKRRDC